MNTPPQPRPPTLGKVESPAARGVVTPLPEGLVDWLQPWRSPEDCLSGGLSISRSAEVLLKNVEAARQASMQQLYGLRDSHGGSRGTSFGRISPRSGGVSGRSSLAMKSMSAQRRSRVGVTLLDLASCPSSHRSSIFLPDAVSPVTGTTSSSAFSPPAVAPVTPKSRQASSRWSAADDREEHSAHLDSARVSCTAVTPLMAAVQTSPLSPYSTNHGEDVSPVAGASGSNAAPPAAVPDSARTGSHKSPHMASELVEDHHTSVAVPAIPHFDQFMRDKESLLKILASDPLPPPRRGRTAESAPPAPSSLSAEPCVADEAGLPETYTLEIVEEEEEEEEENGSISPPPPGGGGGNRTARPLHRASIALSNVAEQRDGPLALPRLRGREDGSSDVAARTREIVDGVDDSWLSRPDTTTSPETDHDVHIEDADAPEFDEELNASEHNFGQGGHLACVPGDTLNNRYVLLKQLGVGRSSRVWMAVDLEQCSIARRQLIRVVGESLVRELSNPKDRPLFVAIKVFRCGDIYSACARYEVKMLNYINERVKVQSVQKHFTLGYRSRHPSTVKTAQPSLLRAPAAQGDRGISSPHLATPFDAFVNSNGSLGATSTTPTTQAAQALMGGVSVACAKANFTVEGDHGTHHCLVMDVLGTGVDAAINETSLQGMPLAVVRSILLSAVQGLATLASMNIVHTDLKPENLLFADLDAKTAEEMTSFQASHFGMTLEGGLWTGFTHSRLSVPEYAKMQTAQARERETADDSRLPSTAPSAIPTATTAIRLPSVSSDASPRRVLFTVQVADLGLSFVVPPALRSGVAQLMVFGGPDVVAQSPAAQMQCIRDYYAATVPEDAEVEDGSSLSTSSRSAVTPRHLSTRTSLGVGANSALSSLPAQSPSPSNTKSTPVHLERVSVFHLPDESRHALVSQSGSAFSGGAGSGQDAPLLGSVSSLDSEVDPRAHGDVPAADPSVDRRFSQRDVAASYDCGGLASVIVSGADNGGDEVSYGVSRSRAVDAATGSEDAPTFIPITVVDPRAVAQTASYHSPVAAAAPLRTFGMPATARMREMRRREKEESGLSVVSRDSANTDGSRTRHAVQRESRRREGPPTTVHRTRAKKGGVAGSGESSGGAPRLSDLYSCVVAPPTELEMDILQHQNYSRGAVVQSREYRSPEVLLGDFFLPSCDIWSLGCIAYELVVGRFLFDATTEYNGVMNTLIDIERKRRRKELRRHRRAKERGSRGRDGSPDGGSSQASLSISRRMSKWLDGFRGTSTGGAAVSDLGDSFGSRSPPEKGGSPQLRRRDCRGVTLPSHSDSDDEDAEVHGMAQKRRWVDGLDDNKGKDHRGSPAASVSQIGYDTVVRAEAGARSEKSTQDGTFPEEQDAGEADEEGDDIDLNSEEEEEVLMAVHGVYFDEYEKDIDVFHLKCMMRLVGPPPLGYLRREPEGVYVRDFFDEQGAFLFYDDQAVEEKEYGIDQIQPLLHCERQLARQSTPVLATSECGATELQEGLASEPEAALVTYDSLFRPGRASGPSASIKASPALEPVSNAEAPHSPLSADLVPSGSATPSVLSLPFGGSEYSAGSLATERLPRLAATQLGYTPLSTANYPVLTPAWRQLQRDIREKMGSESEAVAFESLLRQCLQWDPARRPDAVTLLHSPWLTAFGDVARE